LLSAFSMMGPFWATSTSLLSGTAAAAGIALINSFGNLGGFFGPYVIGVVRNATGDFRGGLIIAGAMLAVSGGLAIAVSEIKPLRSTCAEPLAGCGKTLILRGAVL